MVAKVFGIRWIKCSKLLVILHQVTLCTVQYFITISEYTIVMAGQAAKGQGNSHLN